MTVSSSVDIVVKLDVELGQVAAMHTEEHNNRVSRPVDKTLHLNFTVVSEYRCRINPRIHLCFSISRFTEVKVLEDLKFILTDS